MQSRVLAVDGIRMRWEEEGGEGVPVVLIHGIPTDPSLWRYVIPRLQGAHVFAWEMAGYGASMVAGKGRDISVAKQADYLVNWMRALRLGRVVLVGHDLGGGVAQIVTVRHPELVQGLVLVDSIAYDSWPIPVIKRLSAVSFILNRLPLPVFRLLFQALIFGGHDNKARARESFRRYWQHYNSPEGLEAFIHQIRSLHTGDTLAIAERLPRLYGPVRIAWGTADEFQQIGYGYRLAYELRATLDRIEGGKHFVPEDHPEAVAATINELLFETRHPREAPPALAAR